MRPLIIYQAPWDWSFLWNRAQPLATALSAHASVLYLNCGVENTDLLARIIRRIPKIRSWARNRFHWGTLERIGEKLFVHHWQSLKENQWFLVSRDRPERSYRMLSRVIRRLAVGHDEVWLLTSRPAARGLLDLWPWDRVIVDIEDPWLELNWADSIPREWVYDLLRTAEVVFANGPMIARDYSAFSAREVVNLPNGIDQSFLHRLVGFSAPPDFFNSPSRPRLVYTGHINNRINTVMLAEVIDRCPTVDFYFVGKANVTEIGSELWNKLNERKISIVFLPSRMLPSQASLPIRMHCFYLILTGAAMLCFPQSCLNISQPENLSSLP